MAEEHFSFSLHQGRCQPSVPIVKVGNEIAKGQKIAVSAGMGANLHSSVSGIVSKISADAIDMDLLPRQPEEPLKIPPFEDFLFRIEEAGVVGAGGAGFPAHLKYSVKIKGGILIANGAECEPLHHHNLMQLENDPASVIKGLQYAMRITGAARGVIAIKEKHTRAREILQAALGKERRIRVELLPDKYPVGEERALIREIFGLELAPGEIPFKRGFLVSNIETLANMRNAIDFRYPVIAKRLTLAGRIGGEPGRRIALNVPIGRRIGEILEDHGGVLDDHGEIIVNGPFMGTRADLSMPVDKITNSLLITEPFPSIKKDFGLLSCACGGGEHRLRQIVDSMGGWVTASEKCKQVIETETGVKCEKPGHCPGQTEKVLNLKKSGAEALMVGTCTECTQTVMEIAPKLGLEVIHQTDHVLKDFSFHSDIGKRKGGEK